MFLLFLGITSANPPSPFAKAEENLVLTEAQRSEMVSLRSQRDELADELLKALKEVDRLKSLVQTTEAERDKFKGTASKYEQCQAALTDLLEECAQ